MCHLLRLFLLLFASIHFVEARPLTFLISPTFGYNVQTERSSTYDNSAKPTFDYDTRAVFSAIDVWSEAANRTLLSRFSGFLAAKTGTQLEFGFVKNLENPNFVLYKSSEFNPSMLRPGEYTLNLPYLRNEALDWAQNQQALQRAMNIGNPIREANPNALGGWLQRERDFLGSGGWQRTQQGSDLFWVKPSGK